MWSAPVASPGRRPEHRECTVYARSTTVKAQNDAIEQGIAQVRDEVLPTVSAMDGCIGLSMMVDRTSGECIVTTAWESEEALRGSADTVTPIDQGKRLAALMRAGSLTVLPGVGHIPHIENPRGFDVALEQALDRLEFGSNRRIK